MAQKEIHLRDYLAIIYKHDFVILTSFLLIFGSAFIFSLHIPKTYESSAKIQVQSISGSGVSSDSLFQRMLAGGADRIEMETLCRRLSSESLLKSVVTGLQDEVKGAEFLPSIGVLKARIKAQVVSGSRLINVSIRLKEEEGGERNAAILINRLIEQLQYDISREKNSETQSRMGVVDKVIDEVVDELNRKKQEQRDELFNFMEQNGIPRIWYEELKQILTTRRETEVLIENTIDSIAAAKLELKKLDVELKKYPELVESSQTLTDSPVFLGLMEDSLRVDSLIAKASEDLGADLSKLNGLKAQKAKIESQLHDFKQKRTLSTTKTISPTHLALLDRKIDVEFRLARAENMLKAYEARLKKVDARLAQLVKTIPEKEYKYGGIVESINRIEALDEELFKRKIDAQIVMRQSETDSTPFKGGILVIDPALPKRAPVSPNLTRIWAAAMFIGIAVGLAAAWMLEYLNNAVKT